MTLAFRQIARTGKSSSVPRPCGDPGHSKGGAARWRVALLDYPVRQKFGVELVVCTPCRNRIQGVYDEALGVEEAKAA